MTSEDDLRFNCFEKCSELKLEELFSFWLALDNTQEYVYQQLENAKLKHNAIVPGKSLENLGALVPPRSPPSISMKGKRDTREKKMEMEEFSLLEPSPLSQRVSANSNSVAELTSFSTIPRFYSPVKHGAMSSKRFRAISSDTLTNRQVDIDAAFQEFPSGVPMDEFVAITKDLCGFPSFFNAPLFRRIFALYGTKEDSAPVLNKQQFVQYWTKEIEPFDYAERFFRLLKRTHTDYIEQIDFAPYLQELLTYHPGLDFLKDTPEFQEKYALCVVVRIYYHVDKNSSGRITLRDIRKSNLVSAFNAVDEEEDINKVNCYFSYEHFYVLYCKFWELDTDHDFRLNRDDLMRYGGHALTRAIVDKIFEYGARPFGRIQSLTWDEKNELSYEDFIYFMLSEEDKGNAISLRYWFDLIDFDGDQVIQSDEMRALYNQQIHRMESLGHEVIPFKDILCQLSDLLSPQVDGEFRFSDFIRPDKIRISGVFFNVLFNLSKFIAFEQRDPFLMRQQMAEPQLTDWDRYASSEYARLAMEEEARDDDSMEIDGLDGWYVSETPDAQPDDMQSSTQNNSDSLLGHVGSRSKNAEAPF